MLSGFRVATSTTRRLARLAVLGGLLPGVISGVLSRVRGIVQPRSSRSMDGCATGGESVAPLKALKGLACGPPGLLIYPHYVGLLDQGVLLFQFARDVAERGAGRLRKIRRRPVALRGGVAGTRIDTHFRRHRLKARMGGVLGRVKNLRLAADVSGAQLGKCRGGHEQGEAENEQGLLHGNLQWWR